MIIKSKAGTEIAKNGYTVIDELNQIPMIKTNYLQLEHNHINPIIIGSKAFEHKDIFVNVVEDTETSGDTAFKEYNAIHEFAWILSGMRKHDSYTGYLSLEQYLTMVLEGTDFTYQVEGGHQYYALQFENLGDGESHLDMFFKMLSRWNTEFELRGKKVYITHQRGRLRDKHVGRYKMNIIDTIINSDITDGATAVWGYFGKKDEENPENSTYREFYWQIDELVEQYGIRYAKPYSNENITQEETMIEYLNNILLDSWKISTEVDIAEITDEVAHTGDEYVAVDERLGITLNTRIQKLESVYDADDKLLYQTATLGTVSFASAASGSSSQLQEVIEKIKKDYNDRITDLKQEFDNRFNDEVTQIEIDFTELVNGVRQEIQADYDAMSNDFEQMKIEQQQRIDDLYEGLGDLSSEFENLEIGGRNLFIETRDFRRPWDMGSNYTTGQPDVYGDNNAVKINGGNVIFGYNVPHANMNKFSPNTFTFSAWFRADKTYSTPRFGYRNGTATSLPTTTITTDWKKITFTFTTTNETTEGRIIYWYSDSDTSNNLYVCYPKLEQGDKATDWTPAPEDVEQKLTIIANDLDGVQTKVEDNAGNISTVTQLANGLETRVSNAEGNINTITNLANGTQQTVTNMLNGTATKGTVFQNTVDGFLGRVWQTDIDNLQIGGRNLVLNSDDLKEGLRASGITTTKVDDGIYKNVLKVNNPNLASYITINADNYASYPTPNKDFTVSFLVKGKAGTGKEPKLSLYYNSESGYQEYSQVVSENEYRWISLTYNLGKTAPSNHIGVGNFTELYIARMKVEHGNKPTDYSPAPEDLMKYTDIIARPDGFLIGTFEMGGDKIAQAIVGKAGAIDLIADNVNLSNNLNVANQIKSVSLETVYANISELRTRMLVADVITASMVKFDTALIEKFTSSTAFINSLTAKSAFINTAKVTELISTDGRDSFTLAGGQMNWTRSNGQTMQLGIDGIYMKNSDGSTRFQMDRGMVTSAALGTSNSNVYLATDTGYEARVVDRNELPGDGLSASYTYRPLRLLSLMFPPGLNAYFGTDGEFRFMSEGLITSGVYRDIRYANSYSQTGNYYGVNNNVLKVNSTYIESQSFHDRTYSSSANMVVTLNGIVGRATSARKYKLAIEHQFADWKEQLNHSKKMLEIRPSTWFDRFEAETYAEEIELGERIDEEDFKVKRHFGAIADEFDELGLTELVQYNEDDEVEGLAYDRMSVHHNVLIKDLYDENDTLKTEIAELKSQINKIMEMIK